MHKEKSLSLCEPHITHVWIYIISCKHIKYMIYVYDKYMHVHVYDTQKYVHIFNIFTYIFAYITDTRALMNHTQTHTNNVVRAPFKILNLETANLPSCTLTFTDIPLYVFIPFSQNKHKDIKIIFQRKREKWCITISAPKVWSFLGQH